MRKLGTLHIASIIRFTFVLSFLYTSFTLVSDNVFRVGASVRTFVELQNALHFFEQQTHSQFYMRRLSFALERGKENVVSVISLTVTGRFGPNHYSKIGGVSLG